MPEKPNLVEIGREAREQLYIQANQAIVNMLKTIPAGQRGLTPTEIQRNLETVLNTTFQLPLLITILSKLVTAKQIRVDTKGERFRYSIFNTSLKGK